MELIEGCLTNKLLCLSESYLFVVVVVGLSEGLLSNETKLSNRLYARFRPVSELIDAWLTVFVEVRESWSDSHFFLKLLLTQLVVNPGDEDLPAGLREFCCCSFSVSVPAAMCDDLEGLGEWPLGDVVSPTADGFPGGSEMVLCSAEMSACTKCFDLTEPILWSVYLNEFCLWSSAPSTLCGVFSTIFSTETSACTIFFIDVTEFLGFNGFTLWRVFSLSAESTKSERLASWSVDSWLFLVGPSFSSGIQIKDVSPLELSTLSPVGLKLEGLSKGSFSCIPSWAADIVLERGSCQSSRGFLSVLVVISYCETDLCASLKLVSLYFCSSTLFPSSCWPPGVSSSLWLDGPWLELC